MVPFQGTITGRNWCPNRGDTAAEERGGPSEGRLFFDAFDLVVLAAEERGSFPMHRCDRDASVRRSHHLLYVPTLRFRSSFLRIFVVLIIGGFEMRSLCCVEICCVLGSLGAVETRLHYTYSTHIITPPGRSDFASSAHDLPYSDLTKNPHEQEEGGIRLCFLALLDCCCFVFFLRLYFTSEAGSVIQTICTKPPAPSQQPHNFFSCRCYSSTASSDSNAADFYEGNKRRRW